MSKKYMVYVKDKEGNVLGEYAFEHYSDCVVEMVKPSGDRMETIVVEKKDLFQWFNEMDLDDPDFINKLDDDSDDSDEFLADELEGLHPRKKLKKSFHRCPCCSFVTKDNYHFLYHQMMCQPKSATGDLLLDTLVDMVRDDDSLNCRELMKRLIDKGFEEATIEKLIVHLMNFNIIKENYEETTIYFNYNITSLDADADATGNDHDDDDSDW